MPSMHQLFLGAAPRVDARKSPVMKSPVMCACPSWTPRIMPFSAELLKCVAKENGKRLRCPSNPDRAIDRQWECLPLNSLSAARSGVRPSSASSILSVILGLNLFSSSYPGVYIVDGKKMWTSMPYSNISEWRVSARPFKHVNVSRAILNLGPTPQCVLRRRVRRPSHERHESEGWRNKSDFSLSVLFHHHLWDCLRLLSGLAG